MSLVAQTLARCVFYEDGDVVPHRIAVEFVMFFVDDPCEFGSFGVREVFGETLDYRLDGALFLFRSHGGSLADPLVGGKGRPYSADPLTEPAAPLSTAYLGVPFSGAPYSTKRWTNASASSATSRQPESMVSECPRPGMMISSVMPMLFLDWIL